REIALAIGVPPMLLGIPGDATYSNYAEAQRAFWRQTVLPLVNRMAQGFSKWLSPAYGAPLLIKPDLDQVEALNPEREALWTRLNAATFLTDDEKRAAAGYGVKGDVQASAKFNPYHDGAGRFTTADGVGSGGGSDVSSSGEGVGTERAGPRDQATEAQVILVGKKGGVAKALWKLTIRQFVSQYCKGEINRELPDELSDLSIEDVFDLAKGGDARARKCQKLINQGRFRK
ncbi:MAG: phage portal protein, partial [Hyphomicrobium sp.]